MAPEILKGQMYDYRADFWSLGIILYQMVYGYLPYEEKDVNRLNKLITNTKLNFPKNQTVS
jgi:serine/threonine protein kinase